MPKTDWDRWNEKNCSGRRKESTAPRVNFETEQWLRAEFKCSGCNRWFEGKFKDGIVPKNYMCSTCFEANGFHRPRK